MKKEKTLGRKLAFASADIFGGGAFNIVNFLYPGFLALVLGLAPIHASLVLLLSKLWDASIDPFIGFLSDKTNSRFGKRRFYLIVVGPFVLLSFFLLFFPGYQNINAMWLRVLAVTVSYLAFTGVQSLVMIPYYSLSSEIASDYQERASYNSVRLGFSIFASILCVALPGFIVNNIFAADKNLGYIVMSLSFGVLFVISILITGFFAREEIVTPPTNEKLKLKGMARPLKIKAFRQHLLMHLMVQIAMAVMSAIFFFYTDFHLTKTEYMHAIDNNLGAPVTGLIAAALLFGMQIVALPVYLKMIKKRGKMFTYRFGSYIWIAGGLAIFLLPADSAPYIFYIIAAVIGFGISAPGLIPHTVLGDVIDVGELELGERLDGQMGGFANFMVQLGQGIGLGFMMLILHFANFREKTDPNIEISWQPDSAILAIRLIMLLTPVIFLTVGILTSFKYKIDAKTQREIRAQINERNNANSVDA